MDTTTQRVNAEDGKVVNVAFKRGPRADDGMPQKIPLQEANKSLIQPNPTAGEIKKAMETLSRAAAHGSNADRKGDSDQAEPVEETEVPPDQHVPPQPKPAPFVAVSPEQAGALGTGGPDANSPPGESASGANETVPAWGSGVKQP